MSTNSSIILTQKTSSPNLAVSIESDASIRVRSKRFPTQALPHMDISEFQQNPEQRRWNGPYTFIHAADTQFGLIEKFFLKKDNPKWDEEIRLSTKAIALINAMEPKPRFLLICGDMLDTRPGTEEERRTREEQYVDFVQTFLGLDPEIKIICVCGNHDVCDEPTPETIEIYRKQFGPDFFSFWVGGVKFSVLNSQYWKSPATVPELFQKHKEFMETIPDSSAHHSVIFQHIPFFISDPDEDEVVYLNIEKEYRFPVLDQLQDAGVKYIFCGHYHRNAGGKYKDIEQVVTSALGGPLGIDPSGFRVVTVAEDKITSEYIGVEERPPGMKIYAGQPHKSRRGRKCSVL